ncbi:hypothetical protein M2254_003450 [Chryseobacterium sp. BIGb0186]|uniref:hypothetical protein n=2 Tax=Chryseobacterium group TaxID=2782232 RepID=UPI001959328D|nr:MULTISPECIES: hypothetical protein [Chryseobacterium]MBM7417673.1 hypothetical protein [Chryseobacterium sp. JUb44]MDH6211866.1 hypothetical protein [Chryseobacterium sp. BIGb0186]WSO10501.1 hypothetical protein VUJ64_00970 [Chryseobacterium scophthalmum]
MKYKLLFILSLISFIQMNAQNYIFGKISSEDLSEVPNVTVINLRTDEQVLTNRDGHFMISGRQGDILRFFKNGFERTDQKVSKENLESPMNVKLLRAAELIAEVEIKKGLSGDLKIDSKTLNPPKKVEKLKAEINNYLKQKSDPRILAARPGEFVQPKGQGFSIGKVKNKWDDLDLANYLAYALGEQYFTDLKIEKPFINHFINYVLAGGFERQKILKYGFVSDADLMRFQGAVLMRISSYRAPQIQK